MTKVGTGHSTKRSAAQAGAEAARAALAGLAGQPAKAVIVFANPGYDQTALLAAIRSVVGPDTVLCGCSSEGIIFRGGCSEHVCVVSVTAFASDDMTFHAFNVAGFSRDAAACGVEVARRIGALGPERARAAFVFPDGVTGNASALLRGLDDALAFAVPITGGTAGDVMKTGSREFVTHQYLQGEVSRDSVSVLVIGGAVVVETMVSHGCTPLGMQRTVTSEAGGWVHEIDGQPAWDVLKEYLDGDPSDLLSADIMHLCIGEPLSPELRELVGGRFGSDYLIRTPMTLGADRRSLFFPGGLQLGNTIQFTRRDPELVSANAEQCAVALAARRPGQAPVAVFQFDCAGRGRNLFGDQAVDKAVLPLQRAFGDAAAWTGFRTFGEIAQIGRRSIYQNYTVVLCALYPSDH